MISLFSAIIQAVIDYVTMFNLRFNIIIQAVIDYIVFLIFVWCLVQSFGL